MALIGVLLLATAIGSAHPSALNGALIVLGTLMLFGLLVHTLFLRARR